MNFLIKIIEKITQFFTRQEVLPDEVFFLKDVPFSLWPVGDKHRDEKRIRRLEQNAAAVLEKIESVLISPKEKDMSPLKSCCREHLQTRLMHGEPVGNIVHAVCVYRQIILADEGKIKQTLKEELQKLYQNELLTTKGAYRSVLHAWDEQYISYSISTDIN